MVSAAVPTHVPGQSFKGILCRIPAHLVGSAGAAAPLLCSAPGLCWAREAVSELVVPAVVPLGWPVLPVVTSVDVQAFRDSLKHFCLWFFLARSWVLLSMWIQSLFIFKGVQKHEPAGFCSWYLWLLFRCSSISLHLCSLSCPKKLKVFLIDMHRAWSFSWTSVPDSLDESHLKQIPQNNPYLCLSWGADIVKVRCTSVLLLFHNRVLVSALRRYMRWGCCLHPSWW